MSDKEDTATSKLRGKRLGSGERHPAMLREPSPDFYIAAETQEISLTVVTPPTALAHAGRLSHDPRQDPVADDATAGAGTRGDPAGALSGGRPTSPVRPGDCQGPWSGGAGAGRHQLQPQARRLPGLGLPQRFYPAGSDALSRDPSQCLFGPGRGGRIRAARL